MVLRCHGPIESINRIFTVFNIPSIEYKVGSIYSVYRLSYCILFYKLYLLSTHKAIAHRLMMQATFHFNIYIINCFFSCYLRTYVCWHWAVGIVKTKALLREKVWFPGIDKEVERNISNCIPCQACSKSMMHEQEIIVIHFQV